MDYLSLSKPLPKDAIQRTKKEDTRKGYDTTGYGYQYCVNRFNEALGEKWGYRWELLKETQGNYKSGAPYWDLTVSLFIWIENQENERGAVGGHIASLYADALKGAITNAFKKTAAFWGVGKDAYEGTIDDDNVPLPDDFKNITSKTEKSSYPSTAYDICTFCNGWMYLSKSGKSIYCENFRDGKEHDKRDYKNQEPIPSDIQFGLDAKKKALEFIANRKPAHAVNNKLITTQSDKIKVKAVIDYSDSAGRAYAKQQGLKWNNEKKAWIGDIDEAAFAVINEFIKLEKL